MLYYPCATSPGPLAPETLTVPVMCTTSTLYNRMKCGCEAVGAFSDYISTVQGMIGFHVKVQERANHTVVPDTSLPYKMMFSLDLALTTSSNVDASSVKRRRGSGPHEGCHLAATTAVRDLTDTFEVEESYSVNDNYLLMVQTDVSQSSLFFF